MRTAQPPTDYQYYYKSLFRSTVNSDIIQMTTFLEFQSSNLFTLIGILFKTSRSKGFDVEKAR